MQRAWVGFFVSISLLGCACGDDDDDDGGPAEDAGVPDDGSTPDGGPGTDAGPTCVPREQVPSPVSPQVQLAGSCGPDPSCGGEFPEGLYRVETLCLDASLLFPQVFARCASLSSVQLFGGSVDGTVELSDGTLSRDIDGEVDAAFDVPNECHFCQCSALGDDLAAAVPGASCSPQCNGGSCFCTASTTVSLHDAVEVTVSDTALVREDGGSIGFCQDGDRLAMQDPNGVVTVRPEAVFVTPEVCDGLDNDRNGLVDDAPVDCPVCEERGVCGEGVDSTCLGAAGYDCTYTSPRYEATEVTCDSVDNDCDGSIDDDLPCREVCNGQDDDGDGQIDEDALGAPECSTTGVCAVGEGATCEGAQGWGCDRPDDFEPVEATCGDELDNDCNGLVDERCCSDDDARIFETYLTEPGSLGGVRAVALDGSTSEPLVTLAEPKTLITVVVDLEGGKLYWANIQDETIERANLDGTDVEVAIDAGFQPRLALDPAGRRLFWIDQAFGIRRTLLDDLSDTIDVLPISAFSLAVDPVGGKLYVGDANLDAIHRANLDGSELETLAGAGENPSSIAVDPVDRKLYWTTTGGIARAGLDLTALEPVLTVSYPEAIQVDPVARRLYWSEAVADRGARMDIDGDTPEYFWPSSSGYFGQIVACP